MPNYRRAWVPGGTYFFTVNLLQRRGNDLLIREIELLRRCMALERSRRPFSVLAWVVLPDHMHWLWRLPPGDDDFATRWRRIRTDFSLGICRTERLTAARRRRRERGIWQRRYWEHLIRAPDDLRHHIDYIHMNPVKHGHAMRAADWPHSSFHAWVQRGVYPMNWGEEHLSLHYLAEGGLQPALQLGAMQHRLAQHALRVFPSWHSAGGCANCWQNRSGPVAGSDI